MAILPMKQTVIVKRGGELDEWGNVSPGQILTLTCRVDEGSSVTAYRSVGMTNSEIVVASARIFFDKLADIRETDIIVFTNELGITMERNPKEINVKRSVGGKPMLTEVIV
jgi:vacuolar-type H+-ATPase subunit F/Vma7